MLLGLTEAFGLRRFRSRRIDRTGLPSPPPNPIRLVSSHSHLNLFLLFSFSVLFAANFRVSLRDPSFDVFSGHCLGLFSSLILIGSLFFSLVLCASVIILGGLLAICSRFNSWAFGASFSAHLVVDLARSSVFLSSPSVWSVDRCFLSVYPFEYAMGYSLSLHSIYDLLVSPKWSGYSLA